MEGLGYYQFWLVMTPQDFKQGASLEMASAGLNLDPSPGSASMRWRPFSSVRRIWLQNAKHLAGACQSEASSFSLLSSESSSRFKKNPPSWKHFILTQTITTQFSWWDFMLLAPDHCQCSTSNISPTFLILYSWKQLMTSQNDCIVFPVLPLWFNLHDFIHKTLQTAFPVLPAFCY